MKARKRQPLDFTAADQVSAAPSSAASPADPVFADPAAEPPPRAGLDMDLAIFDSPQEGRAPAQAAPAQSVRRVVETHVEAKRSRLFWPMAVAAALLWGAAPVAFALGYLQGVGPFRDPAFAIAILAMLALGPAALILLTCYVLRQAMSLAGETRRTRRLADDMLSPAALAASGAGEAVGAVRLQIEHASAAAAEARERLLALHEALAIESERLTEAAARSARTAEHLGGTLSREREAMTTLSAELDKQSGAVTDAIARQARMVAEASDLAETQIREAEAALAARAADLAAAAGEAGAAARSTAEDLDRQIGRLEHAGAGVGDQLRVVEDKLAEQRFALVDVAQKFRADQEDFAAEAETRTAQLAAFVAETRQGAVQVSESADRAGETLQALLAAAADHFRQILDTARDQRESMSQEAGRSLGAVAEAAAAERQRLEQQLAGAFDGLAGAAEQARKAAEQHAAAAHARVDSLNEAAFAAGQKADAIFEARLTEARDLIEQSAQMVEQAGARTAQKMEEAVVTARMTLGEMERLMAETAARMRGLPSDALVQAEEVKAAVERGVGELLGAARRAAEETQAIDAAFQARVKRNYDILSEAADTIGAPIQPAMLRPAPLSPPAAPAQPPPVRAASPAPAAKPASAPQPPSAEDPRPSRLKLTPTASDEEFRSVFDAAGGPSPGSEPEPPTQDERGEWSWRSLLTTLDDDPAADDSELGDRMAGEIAAMGIDPAALLPKMKTDEVAAILAQGEAARARDVVKKLAPAATRRLVRRLFSDGVLKQEADRFTHRYAAMVQEAAQQDRADFLVTALLGSDAGRAYLLLDAAAGDLS